MPQKPPYSFTWQESHEHIREPLRSRVFYAEHQQLYPTHDDEKINEAIAFVSQFDFAKLAKSIINTMLNNLKKQEL